MKLKNKESCSSKKSRLYGAVPWIVLLIIALIVVGGLVAVYYLWPKEAPEAVPGEQEVKSYVGTITELGKDSFKLQVKAERNYLNEDSEFMVEVDKDTQYSKTVMPVSVPEEDTGSSVQITPAVFSDLKVGDEVVVASNSDIAGKSKFTAVRVEILDVTEIKSYTGKVKSIGNEQMEITAGAQQNYFNVDTVLIVKTDPKTEYFQIYFSKNVSTSENLEGQLEREKISFEDIKVGDDVVVASNQDLKGQTTFFAREISILPKSIQE